MTDALLERLSLVEKEWAACSACVLRENMGKSVPALAGNGNANATYLIVTDAPTASDVADRSYYGEPGGPLLVSLLDSVGISVNDVYATAAVACRSYVHVPATDTDPEQYLDAVPKASSLSSCRSRLHDIIYCVDPDLIITFGEAAWKTLVSTKDRGLSTSISKAQGGLFDTWVPGHTREVRYPVLPLLSLTKLVDSPSKSAHGPIATTYNALSSTISYLKELT